MRNHLGAQSNGNSGVAPWQIQLTELASYRKRRWQQAVEETRRYWNAHRTSTAISSPIVAALFWVLVKGWKGWLEMLYAALLGLILFGCGWGVAFFISLYRAPTQLDKGRADEIHLLTEKLKSLEPSEPQRQTRKHFSLLMDDGASLEIALRTSQSNQEFNNLLPSFVDWVNRAYKALNEAGFETDARTFKRIEETSPSRDDLSKFDAGWKRGQMSLLKTYRDKLEEIVHGHNL